MKFECHYFQISPTVTEDIVEVSDLGLNYAAGTGFEPLCMHVQLPLKINAHHVKTQVRHHSTYYSFSILLYRFMAFPFSL